MWDHLYLGLAVGVACGTVATVLRNLTLSRRRRRRERRLEQLRSLAAQHGLTLLEQAVPDHVVRRASLYRGEIHKVKLSDVFVGSDDLGTYYVAQRRVEGRQHQLLLCEAKSPVELEGYRIEPRPPAEHEASALRRAWNRVTRKQPEPWRLLLQWELVPARTDEGLLALGQRILRQATALASEVEVPLGLEIHGREVLVASAQELEADALAGFVETALGLRRRALQSLRETGRVRLSARAAVAAERATGPRQVASATGAARRTSAPTAPPSSAPQGAAAGAKETDDGADLDEEARKVPCGPMLTAMDLLREVRPPASRRRRGGDDPFEIPEPEEVVQVLSGRSAR